MQRGYSIDDQVSLVAPVAGGLLAPGNPGAGPVAAGVADLPALEAFGHRRGRCFLAAARHRYVALPGAGPSRLTKRAMPRDIALICISDVARERLTRPPALRCGAARPWPPSECSARGRRP